MSPSLAKLAPVVSIVDGKPVTTSIDIAQHFNKRHDTVLRSVRNLECSPEFNARNFAAVEYTDQKGEARSMFRITRDGFVFLCMGFTGKESAKWKESYITAFNAMEAELTSATPRPIPTTKPQKALPGALTIEQQSAIKEMVKGRVEALPKEKQAKAAITLWSSMKSKFGCSYKEISTEQFSDAVSLVARLVLDGELIRKGDEAAPQIGPIGPLSKEQQDAFGRAWEAAANVVPLSPVTEYANFVAKVQILDSVKEVFGDYPNKLPADKFQELMGFVSGFQSGAKAVRGGEINQMLAMIGMRAVPLRAQA